MLLGEKVKLGQDQVAVLPNVYRKQQAQLGVVLSKIAMPGLVSYTGIFYGNKHDEMTLHEEVYV